MPPYTEAKFIDNTLTPRENWLVVERAFDGLPSQLPEGNLLVPMAYWLAHGVELGNRLEAVGVWIDSDEEVETIASDVHKFPVIGVNFPAFTDGRGFSTGHLLRERYHFKGQLRAIGNAIQDQWFYLKRCGFDGFQLPEDTDITENLDALCEFSVVYQSSVEQPEPLFRRR